MERELKKITTPIGKNVIELKSWLTGREKREIMSVFLSDTPIGKEKELEIKGNKMIEAQNKTIEMVVASIDGEKEPKNILNKILDLRSDDFDFVLVEIDKITTSETSKKK